MRIVRLADCPPPALIEDVAPRSSAGVGEVLIRVHACGAILAELSWYPTTHRKSGEPRTRAVPGHEFSGEVAAVGEDVGNFEIGQEVYGMNDWFSDGAMAEYCVAPSSAIAPKPVRLTHVDAASVPISALTAWQGLFDRAKLQPGERGLVHGGAGGVGIFAVQLAHLRGAQVAATASAQNQEFVAGLGADQVIDYEQRRFEESVKEVDVVFDTVGGETLERSWAVLKAGGRMVTVVSSAADSTEPRVKQAFFIVEPSQDQLGKIGRLLDSGRLRTVVGKVAPLSGAPELYATGGRKGRGKTVVVVTS